MDTSAQIAELLLQIKSIKLSPHDPFSWSSGLKSPIYCDNRIALSHPYVRTQIKEALVASMPVFPQVEMIAGVATAGIPHGALLADALGLPFCYVRSKTKDHGRQNKIEGDLQELTKVLVVEDLISTGGSSLSAIHALEEAGTEVKGLLAIFTYGFSIASQRFREEKIQVHTLTNYKTMLEVAKKLSYINSEEVQILAEWNQSPTKWQDQHK